MDNILVIGIAGGTGSGKTTLMKNTCPWKSVQKSTMTSQQPWKPN